MIDGVVCPEVYLKSKYRILWILKEPHDEPNADGSQGGGGWSIIERMRDDPDTMARERAYQPMCYINYGLLHDKGAWEDMPWLRDSDEIRQTLLNIACINIQKLPGGTSSNNSQIESAYLRHRDLILDQIASYAPSHIFACNPHAGLLANDLQAKGAKWRDFGTASAIQLKDNMRLIHVYHPSHRTRGVTRGDYVNEAIKAALA